MMRPVSLLFVGVNAWSRMELPSHCTRTTFNHSSPPTRSTRVDSRLDNVPERKFRNPDFYKCNNNARAGAFVLCIRGRTRVSRGANVTLHLISPLVNSATPFTISSYTVTLARHTDRIEKFSWIVSSTQFPTLRCSKYSRNQFLEISIKTLLIRDITLIPLPTAANIDKAQLQ